MKRRYKIATGFLALVLVATGALALVLSYTKPCPTAPAASAGTTPMKAITYRCYGAPDVLGLEDIDRPVPTDNQVLVKVHAASVNPLDWHNLRGSPYIMRLGTGLGAPKNSRLGVDFAGVVEAIGKNVTKFKPGDAVFGGVTGAFGEYVVVSQDRAIVQMPENATFEQAASLPIAAITALQALRDKGQVEPGQKVLINGASGGVGTFAVQIARSMGAEVTGVCSTRNVDLVRSLGADHVFDYTQEDYTKSGQQFDVIVDMVSNHSLSANRRVLTPQGRLVIIGGMKGNWLGPLVNPVKAMIVSPVVGQDLGLMVAQMRQDDLETLAGLVRSGKLHGVIDRTYTLSEVADAIRYSEEGHARGKIVIKVE